jgi:predicted HNH restriction endonuclease
MWLRSRERAKALRDAEYKCERCGVKQSRAKGREVSLEVHHKSGATRLKEVEDCIRKNLLCDPKELECLCPHCHSQEHITHGDDTLPVQKPKSQPCAPQAPSVSCTTK